MWRFPSNYQKKVVSAAARLVPSSSRTPVASTASCCNPLTCSNGNKALFGNTPPNVSDVPCYRRHHHDFVSNHSAATNYIDYNNATKRYKSTAIISPPEEEPAMGESIDEGGYLGRILNARVYDVAVETELQHAKNLSKVRLVLIEF